MKRKKERKSNEERTKERKKKQGRKEDMERVASNCIISHAHLMNSSSSAEALGIAEGAGEDHDMKAPKKRAETWAQEEITALIRRRREMDGLFNTSKSNKHLWEQISAKMKESGHDRSPTMCIDKWRNLLKEYKRAKHQSKAGSSRLSSYRDLEELLADRVRMPSKHATKLDGTTRSLLNLERRLDPNEHLMAIPSTDANGLIAWGWRDTCDTCSNGGYRHTPGGKVIAVKYGDLTRRIGIDGSAEAIKETIRSAFGIRTERAFWLEDEEGVVRSLDREMPLGTYVLNVDQGICVKICLHDEADQLTCATEERTFYSEDDFCNYLSWRGWTGLREVGLGFGDIETLDDLHPMCVYERAGLVRS